MEVRTALSGPFPRSEALVAASRDFDRGRTTREALEALYARSEVEVVALERALGVDAFTAGYLGWPDLYRPIAESWPGFTVGPLTRSFETNTFFRQPIVRGPPERSPGAIAARLPRALASGDRSRAKVILPGPYTLAGVSDNRSGDTAEGLIQRLGRLLADEVHELRGLGYAHFQFQEPLLVTQLPQGPRAESVVAAYRPIAAQTEGATSGVWTYFGDAAPALPLLERLPVGIIGIDLSETEPGALQRRTGRHALGLGVIDPRTTLAEDPAHVAEIVRALQSSANPPAEVWLGPGAPLDLLSAEAAERKLRLLPATRAALARSNGGRR